MAFEDFIKDVKKVNKERHHKVSNSYGSKDAFHFYRKIKPDDSKYVLTDCQYLRIIRLINSSLRDSLIQGEDIILPERMGRLEVRKRAITKEFKNGKLKTNRMIDWNATLKLWYNDKEAKHKKQLVRLENKKIFSVFYNRGKAKFTN